MSYLAECFEDLDFHILEVWQLSSPGTTRRALRGSLAIIGSLWADHVEDYERQYKERPRDPLLEAIAVVRNSHLHRLMLSVQPIVTGLYPGLIYPGSPEAFLGERLEWLKPEWLPDEVRHRIDHSSYPHLELYERQLSGKNVGGTLSGARARLAEIYEY